MNGTGRAAWRGYVVISLVWLAVVAVALLLMSRRTSQPIQILPPPTSGPTATSLPTATPRPLRVDVAGAVVDPAVYTLPPGSIVADAVAAAGGPAADADLDRINKAIELQDGMQVYVPRIAETPPAPAVSPLAAAPLVAAPLEAATSPVVRSAPAVALSGPIDLNTASLAELESLPGIGPKMAQLIAASRPYATPEDLLRVKGIGPATLAKIKDLVTVR